MRAAAMVEDISGMDVTTAIKRIPRVLEAIPVISAIWSALHARKNPETSTPAATNPNNAHARPRPMRGSESYSLPSWGLVLYTTHMPMMNTTIRTTEDRPTSHRETLMPRPPSRSARPVSTDAATIK